MNIYTLPDAKQQLSSLLEQASQLGEVYIKRQDGKMFILKPVQVNLSPLEVPIVEVDISSEEVVDIVRQMRER